MNSFKNWFGLSFILLFSFLFFAYLFGFSILNPHQTAWIISGDSSVFFYGFNFFNHEAWTHPLGKIIGYSYPESSSIVYTDSIPFVALFCKLFFKDQTFQYYGIWMLFCILMQGAMSYYLLDALPLASRVLGSILFITLPTFLNRCFEDTKHYSLLAQFFVLLGIFLYSSETRKKSLKLWLFAITASLGVHLYFTFIILFFFVLSFSWDELKALFQKKEFYFSIVGLSLLAYELGYFTIPFQNSTAGGFGFYAMNLTEPFDSMGRSKLLPPLPHSVDYHEGFQFLGLGIMGLIGYSLLNREKRNDLKGELKKAIGNRWVFWFGIFVLCTSFQVMFLNFKFMEWAALPLITAFYTYFRRRERVGYFRIFVEAALLLLSIFACGKIFRATGRFFWVIEYFLLFLLLKSKPNFKVLLLVTLLQLYDLSPFFSAIQKQQTSLNQMLIPPPLELGPQFQEFDHVAVIGGYYILPPEWLEMALEHGKTIGPLMVARASSRYREREKIQIQQELETLQLRNRVLYLVGDEKLWNQVQARCQTETETCSHFITGFYRNYHYILKLTNLPL